MSGVGLGLNRRDKTNERGGVGIKPQGQTRDQYIGA